MSGFVLTNKALNDLKEIGRYTEQTWGLEQRNRYLLMIDQSIRDLVAAPTQGERL